LDSIRRFTIVAAHPDDEVLGCGGLVARLVAAGAEASLLTLTGVTSSRAGAPAATVETEQGAATRVLGIVKQRRLDFPDNRLDTVPLLELVREVEREHEFAPELVLTHAPGDLNVDHRLAHQATLTAFRPTGARSPRLLGFETVSSTEWQDPALMVFRPNCWVDISAHLDTKLEAMRCYASELRAPPHPRSLEGIRVKARSRGFEIGVDAAEAFQIIRDVA
jgi:LmbE family N-acetylglucosaminyl deacetylase